MTVREFIETCEDTDIMFCLHKGGPDYLSITSKRDGESRFNSFLKKHGEKKIKSWHLHHNKLGYLYSIAIVEE